MNGSRTTLIGLTVAALCLGMSAVSATTNAAPVTLELKEQPLATALRDFARQTGIQIAIQAELANGKTAPSVNGQFEPAEALAALLRGTGLVAYPVNGNTFGIRSANAKPLKTSGAVVGPVRLAQASGSAQGGTENPESTEKTNQGSPEEEQQDSVKNLVDEVIVTGSHIRGAENLSSPVIRFEREDIEKSGFGTTQQLLHSLPQNLNSVSDSAVYSGGPPVVTSFVGSGANLRGLGADSTLVLLNGRRLAATGRGEFVDLSLIPLAAIDRMEVLTDGASAIYGSDAVGGVINLVLRKDFNGAETRVRYGAVTEGSHDELQVGHVQGYSWNSGQLLLSYEYLDRSPLYGADRSFYQPIGNIYDPTFIPEQTRHGALAVVEQRLSDRVRLSGDFFFGDRSSHAEVARQFRTRR